MKKMRIYSQQSDEGMEIYLSVSGEDYYVTTHRKNNDLFFLLSGKGRTIDELRQWKPGRNKAEQRLRCSLDHILKLANYILKYEINDAA